MKKYHLFPCSCGKIHEVLPTQAGTMITCECGKTVEVPSVRELKTLPVVERAAKTTAVRPDEEMLLGKEGGTRQRRTGQLVFAGVFGAVFALYGIFLYLTRPRLPDFSPEYFDVFDTWQWWQRLRAGVDVPPDRYEFLLSHYIDVQWRWIFIMTVLTAVCALWMLAVLVAPAKK